MSTRASRQRGVAIITALVVVAAATVVVSAMMWRQAIAVRKVENQDALAEARWLARSSFEWARLILLQDARTSTVDHLGELWALPLAETRVTEEPGAANATATQSTFADNDAAYVSGRIVDAQSRFNLTGLANNGQLDEARLKVLARLLDLLGMKVEIAKSIAARFVDGAHPDDYPSFARTLVAADVLGAADAERLGAFVDVLPVATAVNLNTAPPEVVAACFEDLPLDAARALVRTRDQAWFNQISDATARLPGTSGKLIGAQVAVSSGWFIVRGRVRVGRAELEVAGLIEREPTGTTRVRSFREL